MLELSAEFVYPLCFQEVPELVRTTEKLDRKALREDAVLNAVNQAGEYVRANLNLVLGVLAGVAVVVLLGVLWKNDARQKAAQSDLALSQVVLAYAGGQLDRTIELANALQTTAANSPGGIASKYLAGAAMLRLGRFPEAEQSLRAYLEGANRMPLYQTAAQGALASTLEAQGRHAEAATLYQELAAKLSGPAALQAQLDAAGALTAAGSADQAKSILEKLSVEQGPIGREAKLELAILQGAGAAAGK